ncbi:MULTISPECIES: hypothetical protein [unclassified Haloferax]|uniref:hypothetical protein n=1 Tax=unclassified Haloferax TaxID=2625095 RepID=UPI0011C04429|nr:MULTISPECIES: hypothetical protein [unclassified Haloferax]
MQKNLIAALNEHWNVEVVCEWLMRVGSEATDRGVDVVDLVVKNRVSKPLDEYTQSTRNVAALERAESRGVVRSPG